MFTGGFQKMSRSEAKSIVENNGGKVLGTISKKLDILVIGNSKPTKKKIENAKQLNIKTIQETCPTRSVNLSQLNIMNNIINDEDHSLQDHHLNNYTFSTLTLPPNLPVCDLDVNITSPCYTEIKTDYDMSAPINNELLLNNDNLLRCLISCDANENCLMFSNQKDGELGCFHYLDNHTSIQNQIFLPYSQYPESPGGAINFSMIKNILSNNLSSPIQFTIQYDGVTKQEYNDFTEDHIDIEIERNDSPNTIALLFEEDKYIIGGRIINGELIISGWASMNIAAIQDPVNNNNKTYHLLIRDMNNINYIKLLKIYLRVI